MIPITDINQLDLTKSYTYADYLTWQFKERVELIMGKIFKMSPAPMSQHQYTLGVILTMMSNHVRDRSCHVFAAPFDVTLPITNEKGEPNTVVQPDLCVICNSEKITEKGCNGAPDLIVEILSKSSVMRDLHYKYELYERCGVREYWIISPNDKSMSIFYLEHGKYITSRPMTYGDQPESRVLQGLQIDLNEVFQDVVQEPEEGYLPEGVERL